jgi:hypothetical protein
MSHVSEYYPDTNVVVDNTGEIRVPDDYIDGDSFKEIPDPPVLYDAIEDGVAARRLKMASDEYYEQFDLAEQKFSSPDLARADLARRGFIEPTQGSEPATDYAALSRVSAELIRQATHDEVIAKAERDIFDPDELRKAITKIHADFRLRSYRRHEQ